MKNIQDIWHSSKRKGEQSMKEEAILTRKYRERLLADGYRPMYHFAICERTDLVGASHHILDIFRKD